MAQLCHTGRLQHVTLFAALRWAFFRTIARSGLKQRGDSRHRKERAAADGPEREGAGRVG